MDLRIIEVRKNIIIRLNIVAGTSSYTSNIDTVDFIPDEVTVKYINYGTSAAVELGAVTLIYTDLISDYIASFVGNVGITPNSTYTIRKPVKGNYTFNMHTITGAIEDGRVGEFTMHLEFVQYRKDLPDKKIF